MCSTQAVLEGALNRSLPNLRIASHLFRAPNFKSGEHEFKSPMWQELGALTNSGKTLGSGLSTVPVFILLFYLPFTFPVTVVFLLFRTDQAPQATHAQHTCWWRSCHQVHCLIFIAESRYRHLLFCSNKYGTFSLINFCFCCSFSLLVLFSARKVTSKFVSLANCYRTSAQTQSRFWLESSYL